MQEVPRRKRSVLGGIFFGASITAIAFAGCGTKNEGSGFTSAGTNIQGASSGGNGADGSGDDSTAISFNTGDDGGISLLLDGSVVDRAPPPPSCKLPGLWCYQTSAPCTTTLSGT